MEILKEIVNKLIEKHMTISTMESCTGGFVVNAITNIEGASEVLKYSAITYSNEFKEKMGVDKKIIDKYSVYSKEVADEMSKKISAFTNSDYSIGVTGKLNRVDVNNISGEDNKVYFSIYDKNNDKIYSYELYVDKKNRIENKEQVLNEFRNNKLEQNIDTEIIDKLIINLLNAPKNKKFLSLNKNTRGKFTVEARG